MHILLQLGQIFFQTFLIAIVYPMFWVVFFLVYLQYKRIASMELRLFGRVINPLRKQLAASFGLGLLAGLLASLILFLLGLSLEQIGLYYIWPVALLLLLLFNPRYFCFAYAGGIVALLSLFIRFLVVPLFPAAASQPVIAGLIKIHIPALLALIGLLHLMEALLIYIGGHWGASPIYCKNGQGEVVGAFSLQRFWPIPLVALMMMVVLETEIAGVSMPEWWPLIKSGIQPEAGKTLQYMAVPVAAGLGYGDLAISSTPREKAVTSAKYLGLYSALLLGLAVAAAYYPQLILPGVLLAPLGHELLIAYGNQRERTRKPLYRQGARGVTIMMVLPGSAAEKSGLQAGDRILRLNGAPVNSCRELDEGLSQSYFLALLEGERDTGPFSIVLRKEAPPESSAEFAAPPLPVASIYHCAEQGIIVAPSQHTPVFVEFKRSTIFSRLLRWFRQ